MQYHRLSREPTDASPGNGRRRMRMLRRGAVGLLAALAVGGFAAALTRTTAFTVGSVADTTGEFSSFGSAPAINATGAIAFVAGLDTGGSGIFVASGSQVNALATSSGPYSGFAGNPSIDASGAVAFIATRDAGGSAVFVARNGAIASAADTSGPFSSFAGTPAIVNGRVAFYASLDNGESGIFTNEQGARATVADTQGVFNGFAPAPAINDAGAVAFVAGLDAGGSGLFVARGGQLSKLADTSGPFSSFGYPPAINAAGDVVFYANLDDGGSGVFVFRQGQVSTIVDTNGPFADFDLAPAINRDGTVAFQATLDDGDNGIFKGPDPIFDRVIAIGDSLGASTVRAFSSVSLSDDGKVAFAYQLANNTGGIAVAAPQVVAPTASTLVAPNVTSGRGQFYQLKVTYSDDAALDVASLGNGDVRVTGPNGFDQLAQFVRVDRARNGTPRTVLYRITPPGGNWDAGDNGAYNVNVVADEVRDNHGTAVAAGNLGAFTVAINSALPGSALRVPLSDVNRGGAAYEFEVEFASSTALDAASLGNGDVRVTGPNGFDQPAELVRVDNATNGALRRATYRITPPGGNWDAGDNGAYRVSVVAGEVRDTAGNFVPPGVLAGFDVAVDTVAPTARLNAPLPDVVAGKANAVYRLDVEYADDVALDAASLGDGDLVLSGPNGFNQPVTLLRVEPARNSTPRRAIYRVTAPGGRWDAADVGEYRVSVASGQVLDASGNAAAPAVLGSFRVTADNRGPLARVVAAPSVGAAGGTRYEFAVQYDDDAALDAGTLGSGDVRVTGPRGFNQLAALVRVETSADGARRGIYRITPPGGNWNAADNGSYAVYLVADQVRDAAGNPARGGPIGSFVVSLDDVPPGAVVVGQLPDASGGASYEFAVQYDDNSALDAGTLGNGDVRVTGPRGFNQPALLLAVDAPGNGTPRKATYRIPAPGGSWDAAENGRYTILTVADQVRDSAGNAVAATRIGSFRVRVANGNNFTPQVESIARLDASPTATGRVRFAVSFNRAVTGVDASDFVLVGSGVRDAAIVEATGRGKTWVVLVTTGVGSGALRVDLADDDTIVDIAGNSLGGAGAGNGSFELGESYLIDREAQP